MARSMNPIYGVTADDLNNGPFPYGSDNDPNNPVDMSADDWLEVYSRMDDPEGFLDHDHSMDY